MASQPRSLESRAADVVGSGERALALAPSVNLARSLANRVSVVAVGVERRDVRRIARYCERVVPAAADTAQELAGHRFDAGVLDTRNVESREVPLLVSLAQTLLLPEAPLVLVLDTETSDADRADLFDTVAEAGFAIAPDTGDSVARLRERPAAGAVVVGRRLPASVRPYVAAVVRRAHEQKRQAESELARLESRLAEQETAMREIDERARRAAARERELRDLLLAARDDLALPPRPQQSVDPAPDRAAQVRRAVERAVPQGTSVLVLSAGDDALVALAARRGFHFPQHGDGRHAEGYEFDGRAAIDHLEALRARGAEFFVLPKHARGALAEPARDALLAYLRRRYAIILDSEACVVFALGPAPSPSSPPPLRPLAACSIISRNYLAQARVLAESFLEHEPAGRFYLLVVDGLPRGVRAGGGIELIDPAELNLPTFYEMCFKYDVVEFSTAVKPPLLSLLLTDYGEEQVVYLDPDILVMSRLDKVHEGLTSGSIVLTPHVLAPVPADGKTPSERDILISGAYNLGFLGLARSADTAAFLDWWTARLEDGCRIDVAAGLFTDQKWVDLVPGIFGGTVVLRDPAYNVAFWNLHDRTIERRGSTYVIDERPIAFFHASGFDPRKRDVLSKHQNRISVQGGTPLADLLEHYANLLVEAGFYETSSWEYGYSRFDNGVAANSILRQLYLGLDERARRMFGNPFETDRPDSFLEWALEPADEPPRLSPFLHCLYRLRYDVGAAFPDLHGDDRQRFIEWASTQGPREMGYEPELVRAESTPGAPRTPVAPPVQAVASGRLLYDDLVRRVRDVVIGSVPADAVVAVASKGDDALVDFGGRHGWHFPRQHDGAYAGYYPRDGDAAIRHLEALRHEGADFLVFPATATWWLAHPTYETFARHLRSRYSVVLEDSACTIFDLAESKEVLSEPRVPEAQATNGWWDTRRVGAWWRRRRSDERVVVQ